MRFCLLDRILSWEPDAELTAIKTVSLAEEYLADHFPEFPVLPGVFMLESAAQAATWLVRLSENYAHSMIVLTDAKGVKFTDFVAPGRSLRMRVERIKRDETHAHFKFHGEMDGRQCVSGRLSLECYNLADQDPELAELDGRMKAYQRTQEALLTRGMEVVEAEKV